MAGSIDRVEAYEKTLQLYVLQVKHISNTTVYAYKYDTLPEHSAMQDFP
jgi:hypothetical protein